jgi:uncharacterized membrane protein YgcG
VLASAGTTLAAPPAGPPYPDQVVGQRVYDYAGIFTADTKAQAQAIILSIEARTGAQIAVYTQVKPGSDTLDKANADALALMNQWGVGRKGFDDGLVILFDMQPNLVHGEVSLYAGSGYRAAFLSDSDRQSIFDNDMMPLLAEGDMDGGLMAALNDINANATPEHAATLEQGRQINALIALGGLLLGLLLMALTGFAWLRHGRDPLYIDDSSVLMAAPPAGLTPAMATLLLTERTSDRTVSAGLVDLAAHGCIAFDAETSGLDSTTAGVRYLGPGKDALVPLEAGLRDAVDKASVKHDGYIVPSRLYQLIDDFDKFKSGTEAAAVQQGWLTAKPSQVLSRWRWRAVLEVGAGLVIGSLWLFVQASGLFVLGLGLIAAGIVTLVFAGAMPSRTPQGAMLWAMLTAYKRTLALTMAGARSMSDVAATKALPWVTTPDQVMAWGVAFGLDHEIEVVLSRSMVDENAEGDPALRATLHPWYPAWYTTGSLAGASGHASSGAAGIFSASGIPNPSAIMAALGSITSPSLPDTGGSSSGGGFSSGGSFGGGGGGGGGGAGGGF